MSKKESATPKATKKVGPLKSKQRHGGPLGALPDPLVIVPHDSGRALGLRARLGMNRETFARLASMSTRNLANVEAGRPPSTRVLRQLQELRRVIDALAEVIQQSAVGPWLNQPNSALDGLKPIEVIERGEIDRIWQIVFYLRSGLPS